MNCQTLGTNINVCGNTQLSRHYKEKAYIMSFDNLRDSQANENLIDFLCGEWYTVTDVRAHPFSGTSIKMSVGEHGSITSAETVVFPLLDSNPQAAEIIQMLKTGRVVLILEQVDYTSEQNRWFVLGGQNGLKATEESFSNSSDGAWLVTLMSERNNVNSTWFGGDMSLFFDYTYITGLTISNGNITTQKVYLRVDSDKTGYVMLPNNSANKTISGVVDTTWDGGIGDVRLVTPLNNTYFSISKTGNYDSAFSADTFKSDLTSTFIFGGCSIKNIEVKNATSVIINNINCVGLKCPKATTVNAVGCSLIAQVIGDFLISAYYTNSLAVGNANFSGGNNANSVAINAYLVTQGLTLVGISATLSSWVLTFNN